MSDEDSDFRRVYTGLEVNVTLLQELFEKENIGSISRNDFEAGLRGGFGGGFPGQVQLFAEKDHYERALQIVADTFPNDELEEGTE